LRNKRTISRFCWNWKILLWTIGWSLIKKKYDL